MPDPDSTEPNPSPSAPPTAPGEIVQTKQLIWPTVLGIIAIIFGALGALGGVCGMASGVMTEIIFNFVPKQGGQQAQLDVLRDWRIWIVAISLVQMAAALLLLVGGIALLKRSPVAPRICLTWAAIKIAIVAIHSVAQYMMQQSQFEAITQTGTAVPANIQSIQQTMGSVGVALSVLWGWALPAFFIVWFNRKKIVSQTAEWQPAATTSSRGSIEHPV